MSLNFSNLYNIYTYMRFIVNQIWHSERGFWSFKTTLPISLTKTFLLCSKLIPKTILLLIHLLNLLNSICLLQCKLDLKICAPIILCAIWMLPNRAMESDYEFHLWAIILSEPKFFLMLKEVKIVYIPRIPMFKNEYPSGFYRM